jgi:hypothetical protein
LSLAGFERQGGVCGYIVPPLRRAEGRLWATLGRPLRLALRAGPAGLGWVLVSTFPGLKSLRRAQGRLWATLGRPLRLALGAGSAGRNRSSSGVTSSASSASSVTKPRGFPLCLRVSVVVGALARPFRYFGGSVGGGRSARARSASWLPSSPTPRSGLAGPPFRPPVGKRWLQPQRATTPTGAFR